VISKNGFKALIKLASQPLSPEKGKAARRSGGYSGSKTRRRNAEGSKARRGGKSR
jgi:hypothetical protein